MTERNKTSYKFGYEKRDKKLGNNIPGPGQYHIPCSLVDVPRYLTAGSGFNDTMRYIWEEKDNKQISYNLF